MFLQHACPSVKDLARLLSKTEVLPVLESTSSGRILVGRYFQSPKKALAFPEQSCSFFGFESAHGFTGYEVYSFGWLGV